MKKTLNESPITNELRHGSSFFRDAASREPVQTDSPQSYDRTDVPSVRDHRSSGRTYDRTNDRTESPPPKRETKRHPFEIYKDQLERLKRRKAQAVLDGKIITMSDMVRVALDNYLQDHD